MTEEIRKNQIDVLCIGDTVVDTFIKISKAEVHCNIDNVGCTITMPFGAKIPFEGATVVAGVGNAANASVSIARLGMKSAIATELGDDENGKMCLENFINNNVETEPTNTHAGMTTSHDYVLWYPPERTILVKHGTFKRKLENEKFSLNGVPPKFVYISGLPADSLPYHDEILAWLRANRNVKLVFQPGTFQIKVGREAMKNFYIMSHVCIVNKEEAQEILETKESEIQKLLESMQKLGPQIVSITDGPNGAYLRYQNKNYYMPIYPDPKPPFERTGCGDAFASTFTAMLCAGKTPLEALQYAPINSMNVVQHIGAQAGLLSMSELETYLRNAPTDYKPVEI